MRKGKIKNRITNEIIEVVATTEHPDSHYGRPVWVADDVAYIECDSTPNPFYEVVYDSDSARASIGRQLAELRNKKGLSTRELAEMAGVNFANIGKIERGAYNVSVDVLAKVCAPLGAEVRIVEIEDKAE